MSTPVSIRPPSTSKATPPAQHSPPKTTWLQGTWNVSYSTLPMWNSKKNVQITYTPLPPSTAPTTGAAPDAAVGETDRIDDLVSYQANDSSKVKTLHGLDKMSGNDASAWDWRGKGWLSVASSHWEVLGHGVTKHAGVASGQAKSDAAAPTSTSTTTTTAAAMEGQEAPEEWVVTYFAKTLFTPAGIDVYCRPKPKLSQGMVEVIKETLAKIDDAEFTGLAKELFEIRHD